MFLQRLNPPGLLSFDAMAQVVSVRGGRTLYIAGQSACDEQFRVVGNDHYTQSLQALRNLRSAIEGAGGTLAGLASSTVYLKGLTPAVAGSFLKALADTEGPFPAHAFSLIGVECLSGTDLLVEITAIAIVED
ncbi:MAG: RidA family protein [Proteobacteria bacterium]|nr:RidA family protein [Pseudomonadota bacterium]HQR04648.1 RidA family protein [Rhodocyclaceae bacterium]